MRVDAVPPSAGGGGAQSNQTLGFYATSNTTGATNSSTFDARSVTFQGAGIASVGFSNGSVVVSVPSGGGVGDGVNILAAGTQTAATTGTVMFSNSNNVSFGMSNSSVITASASFAQSTQPVAASAANGSFAFSTLSFSNLNGISFGTSAGSAITASHNALTSQSNQAWSGSNASSTFQTLSFNNANGVSWSNNAGAVEASYTRPVVSNAIQSVGSATNSGTNTSRFAADDHVHAGVFSVGVSTGGNTVGDTRVDVGRFVLQGGNNVTLSQITAANALNTIVISGANAGGAQTGISGIQVSDTTYTSGTVTFQNANGISFGASGANGVSASYTRPVVSNAIQSVGSATGSGTNTSRFAADDHVHAGVFSMGVSTAGNTIGDTRVDVGRFVLQGGNSITLSQITAANALNTIILSGPNALTSQSNQAWSGSNASSTFQTLSFNNANGASWSNNAGAVEISYTRPVVSNAIQSVGSATGSGTNTSRFAADDHVHAGVFSFGVSNAGNTAGDTRVDVGRFVLAGGANITLSQATAAGALNTISIVGGAGGGGDTRMTAFATGNTTQSSTGTIPFSSYIFRGSNLVSVGVSNGSIVVDANHAVSAAGGSSTFQTLGFSDNAYASFTNSNGSVAVTELRGSFFATGNTVLSSTGTMNLDTVLFRGSGAASIGVSNGSIIVDVAAGAAAITQSIGMSTQTAGGGTGGTTGYVTGDDILYHFVPGSNITMSQSVNGASGTLSIYGKNDLTYSGWLPFKDIPKASLATNNGSLTVYPVDLPNVQFDRAAYLMSHSNATNSSGSHSLTFRVGIYTLNASTLSLLASGSASTAVTCSGTAGSYSRFSALRLVTLPFTTTLTEGRYWLGMVSSTSSAAANASYSLIAIQKNESALGGMFGVAAANTVQTFLGAGVYSAATNGIPNSIVLSADLTGTNSLGFRPPHIGFHSGTI